MVCIAHLMPAVAAIITAVVLAEPIAPFGLALYVHMPTVPAPVCVQAQPLCRVDQGADGGATGL